tara:strand:- start:2340 stop:2666 length:327 start_codon:yes stop_codon:yes gene_type:complete
MSFSHLYGDNDTKQNSADFWMFLLGFGSGIYSLVLFYIVVGIGYDVHFIGLYLRALWAYNHVSAEELAYVYSVGGLPNTTLNYLLVAWGLCFTTFCASCWHAASRLLR